MGGGASRGLIAYNKIYFVNGQTGSDSNAGLDLQRPFATIQKAVDSVVHHDAILVLPHQSGGYDETVTTPQNKAKADQCTLMGVAVSMFGKDSPQIFPDTDNGDCLILRSPGWRISGLTFAVPASSALCVKLNLDQAANTADTDYSPHTTIDNCRFRGLVAAGRGIDFIGAPHDVKIMHNRFELFTDSCIESTQSSIAQANRCHVEGNYFMDSTHYINMNPRGFKASFIVGNYFGIGFVNTVAVYLDNRGGASSVQGNYMSGTFSNVGFYWADAADDWTGNFTSAGTSGGNPS